MATELQQGNAIASQQLALTQQQMLQSAQQLELTRQQMLQSVEMLCIEAKKLEVAEAAYYAQLRAQFVEDYDRVFLGTRGDTAMRRLCVHDSLYALSLIAKDVQTSYKRKQLPVDLSMDIALVMAHGSSKVHEHLVTIFALEYFLGLETSGTFQQELRTIVDAIAQLLAEQEQAKRLEAEAEAKKIAEVEAKRIEAEASKLAVANYIQFMSKFKPYLWQTVKEQLAKQRYLSYKLAKEYDAMLLSMMVDNPKAREIIADFERAMLKYLPEGTTHEQMLIALFGKQH
ncbi:MAG: hypothetical protein EAZ52_03775 [Alphaproteobacteria bacterium]|nr:MAG: hypothetical protein EAZ66_02500 [Alphaproteobacteria bacterium]TAF76649.1 MAG: hypothetical protein EAZ52_03775 [Alphaproteobacteria bacterium]